MTEETKTQTPSSLGMEVEQYLTSLSGRVQEILGGKLAGLYLIGSACLNDFRLDKSDLNLLAVCSEALSDGERGVLAAKLDHKELACPARALDLVFVPGKAAQAPKEYPQYELWFRTGEGRETEAKKSCRAVELNLCLAVCGKHGVPISSPPPDRLFSPVPQKLVMEAVVAFLEWHTAYMCNELHDPMGQNSILNGCRARYYAREGRFSSKMEAGIWLLGLEPELDVVQDALEARDGNREMGPPKQSVWRFLQGSQAEVFKTLRGEG